MKFLLIKRFLINNLYFLFLLAVHCNFIENKKQDSGCEGKNSSLCAIVAGSSTSRTGGFSVGGTITGLTTTGLVLQNDSVDDITLSANSSAFTFPSRVSGLYSVTVKKQPTDNVCAVRNGSGTTRKDITDVNVYCCYRMGGSVQGCSLQLSSNVTTIAGVIGANGTTDGTGANALFFYPYSMTTDGINFYIVDTFNHLIRKMEISSRVVTTIAGTAGTIGAVDGPGAFSKFNYPGAITTDGTYLYIADTYNHTIRKMELSNGIVTTFAGTAGVTGTADGTGMSARFNGPFGITMDASNLYVTDGYNNTIRKIVISTGVVTTFAGTAGTSGFTNGTGGAATFNKPYGITTDGVYLYVTDNNQAIRKINIATQQVTTLAGGSRGSTDGTGNSAKFSKPTGITTDGTNLFVTDTLNQTIRKIEISTGLVTTLAGTVGVTGSIDGVGLAAQFYFPFGLTTDGTSLYIADTDNNTIRVISTSFSGVANMNRSLKSSFYLAGFTH